MTIKPLQLAVLAILDKCDHYEWSVQGFGLLRLYVRNVGRLHIWDSLLRYTDVSMIHNHSWDLKSTVVSGKLTNRKYTIENHGSPYMTQRLVTGYQTELLTPPHEVGLLCQGSQLFLPGEAYHQYAHEIHETLAEDGTITMMERTETEVGMADVYWPVGTSWGTATPRLATEYEVRTTVARAIHRMGA